MATMTDDQAIRYIVNCANGGGFDKDTVKNGLARYFSMGTIITTSTTTKATTDIITNHQPLMSYWVGFTTTPQATGKYRMHFEDRVLWGTNNPHHILSAFVVPMWQAAGPPLPFMSLNLNASANGPKVVLTNQLTGCTFAIGAEGHDLHMAHVQPVAGAQGKDLAAALKNHGANIFDGLPAAADLSTFLMYPGDTVEHTATGLCYGNKANILGLVVDHGTSYTLTIIVLILDRYDFKNEVKKVLLVTHENSGWTTDVVV